MVIGRLDRKITIQQPTVSTSSDTGDSYPSAWSTYKTCWASMTHKQSEELAEGNQFVLLDTYEWKIRHYDAPDITSRMRISYDSSYYDIVSVKELGRKEAYLLKTQKRDN